MDAGQLVPCGPGALCAYIALAAATHHKALADVEHFAAEQHLQVESLAALPLPPTLTHWVGLVSTPDGVWRTTFHEPGGAVESTQFYSTRSRSRLQRGKKLHDVQVYLWFARFPVWRVGSGKEMKPRSIFPMCDSFATGSPLRQWILKPHEVCRLRARPNRIYI